MVGVFDSGLGGLVILKEIRKLLPQYNYIYFGDTLHVPYGNRSDEAVFKLTKGACEFLFDAGCKLIVLACNTATAKALQRLQKEYLPEKRRCVGDKKINILGVVRPMAEAVAKTTKGCVGVIGTRGTVNSEAYVIELEKEWARLARMQELKVIQRAAPLLVPLIEENWIREKETISILRHYLRPFKKAEIDTLILGCTHYPLLIKEIRRIMGKNCAVPHPGKIAARSFKNYLARHAEAEYESALTKDSMIKFFVTDRGENFGALARRFWGEKITIEKI